MFLNEIVLSFFPSFSRSFSIVFFYFSTSLSFFLLILMILEDIIGCWYYTSRNSFLLFFQNSQININRALLSTLYYLYVTTWQVDKLKNFWDFDNTNLFLTYLWIKIIISLEKELFVFLFRLYGILEVINV